MTRSQRSSTSAVAIPAAESTWRGVSVNPAWRSACCTRAASSGESSTSRRCRLLGGIGRRNLVEFAPVAADALCEFYEIEKVHRLAQIAVGAEAIALDQIRLFQRRGKDHHGQIPGAGIGANAAQHLEAIDLGQFQIEQHELGLALARRDAALGQQELQRLLAVRD